MDTLPGPSPLRVGFSLGGLPTEIPGGWPGAAAVAKHGLGDPGEPLDVAKVVELGKRGGNSCETHVKLMWNSYETWLVVWNIFLFFHILGIIIPTDYIIFFKMVIAPPDFFFSKDELMSSHVIPREPIRIQRFGPGGVVECRDSLGSCLQRSSGGGEAMGSPRDTALLIGSTLQP